MQILQKCDSRVSISSVNDPLPFLLYEHEKTFQFFDLWPSLFVSLEPNSSPSKPTMNAKSNLYNLTNSNNSDLCYIRLSILLPHCCFLLGRLPRILRKPKIKKANYLDGYHIDDCIRYCGKPFHSGYIYNRISYTFTIKANLQSEIRLMLANAVIIFSFLHLRYSK